MSSVLSITQNIPTSLVGYDMRNTTRAYELDGQQQTFLSLCAAQQVVMLDMQWQAAGYTTNGWIGAAATIVALFKVFNPFIVAVAQLAKSDWVQYNSRDVHEFLESYIGPLACVMEPIVHGLFSLTKCLAEPIESFSKHFDSITDTLFNYTGTILSVACVVSYVAMIALGQPIVGVLGLLGIALSLVKQNGYLPGFIDEALTPLCLLSGLYVNFIANQMLFFKFFLVLGSLLTLVNYASGNNKLRPYLPSFLTNVRPGTHVIEDQNNLTLAIGSNPNQIMAAIRSTTPEEYSARGIRINASEDSEFEVNYSSLHAKELDELLSTEEANTIDQLDPKKLFEDVEAKCAELGFEITPKEGWEAIKYAVVFDRCSDQRPQNFDITRRLLKEIIYSRTYFPVDANIFRQTIQEIAQVGISCTEGWTRDITFLLQSAAKDPSWTIHNKLALFRSDLINGIVASLQVFQNHPDMPELLRNLGKGVGGLNNIHFLNQIQAALYHLWRPYGGEVFLQTTGMGFLLRYLQQDSPISSVEKLYREGLTISNIRSKMFLKESILTATLVQLPLQIPPIFITVGLGQALHHAYKPSNIIAHIEGLIQERTIPWKVIETWLHSLHKRGFDQVLADSDKDYSGYNQELVKNEGTRDVCLTKAGVKLLLWDLGIIHPKRQPPGEDDLFGF